MSENPSLDAGDYPFHHTLRVRFAETDAMGIVHHSRYLPYLEAARVEFLRDAGHPYDRLRDDGVDFAVVEAWLGYRRPLRFDDLVDVHVRIGAVTKATFQVAYLLTVAAQGGGAPVAAATAVTVHGAVTRSGAATRLPAWITELDAST
ncbi:MAG: acyl-CoA thioesterase [Actinomycetota bacterium]|nr:acyl-CoA thioesterase [Actinomycetota bacterium]